MAQYIKIPVVKNQISKRKKNTTATQKMTVLIFVFGMMLTFIWLRVQINTLLAEIQQLEVKNKRKMMEIEYLEGKVVELSRFKRIEELAIKELNLQHLDEKKIIEISKK